VRRRTAAAVAGQELSVLRSRLKGLKAGNDPDRPSGLPSGLK
jgi:hypothetical protein